MRKEHGLHPQDDAQLLILQGTNDLEDGLWDERLFFEGSRVPGAERDSRGTVQDLGYRATDEKLISVFHINTQEIRYIYMYIFVSTNKYTYIYTHTYLIYHIYIYIYIYSTCYIYIYIHIYIHPYKQTYVNKHMCIVIYMCICTYVLCYCYYYYILFGACGTGRPGHLLLPHCSGHARPNQWCS